MHTDINRDELIERLGGIDALKARIRERAKPIAAKKGISVDELLNTVCCVEPLGNEMTYGELYLLTYLDGYEESLSDE